MLFLYSALQSVGFYNNVYYILYQTRFAIVGKKLVLSFNLSGGVLT